MQDCIFCKIANHEVESNIIFENDFVVAFPSIEPAAQTHILIVPKSHIEKFMDDISPEVLSNLAQAAKDLIKQKNIENGYKLIFNGGRYQSIPHLHWHLLAGKLEGDKT